LGEVDGNEVPLCAKYTLRVISDEKEAVGRLEDGLMKIGWVAWSGSDGERGGFLRCAEDGFVVDVASDSRTCWVVSKFGQGC